MWQRLLERGNNFFLTFQNRKFATIYNLHYNTMAFHISSTITYDSCNKYNFFKLDIYLLKVVFIK